MACLIVATMGPNFLNYIAQDYSVFTYSNFSKSVGLESMEKNAIKYLMIIMIIES